MLFDLFHEISLPPHLKRSEAQAYRDTIEEIELGDRLGFRCAWLVEHHFMPGYSHCSKPEMVLAALAQRTRAIRLGFGVIPLPFHHPVHVAERVATLNLLCGGRAEVGIGRGFSPAEFGVFGVPMGESRSRVDEGLQVLRQSLRGETTPPIVPAPAGDVPLWSAAVSPETFDWVAREGLGVLVGPFKPWFMVRHDIERFRNGWSQPEPPRIGMTVGILCLDDERRARSLAETAFGWFYRELLRTTAPVLEALYPSYEHFRELGRFRQLLKLGVNLRLLEMAGMAVVGTPQQCAAKLQRYREGGVTHLLCAVGAGAVESAVVRESMHLIAGQVIPRLAA